MSWNSNNFDGGSAAPAPQPPLTAEQQFEQAYLASLSHFLSDTRVGKPPASKLAVQEMDLIVFDEKLLKKYPDPCTVCTEKFQVEDEAKQFPCKHLFHEDCILQWLERNNSCPLCRYELPTLDVSYEEQKRREAARKAREAATTQSNASGAQSSSQQRQQQQNPMFNAMAGMFRMGEESDEDEEIDQYADDRKSSNYSSMYS